MSPTAILLKEAAIEYRDTIGTVQAWIPGVSEMDDDTVRMLIEAALRWLDELEAK